MLQMWQGKDGYGYEERRYGTGREGLGYGAGMPFSIRVMVEQERSI